MDGSKRRKRKNDRIDANKLARLGRVDPESLYPIQHRSREGRQDLVMLRARDALVAGRTEIINTPRGLVKSMGTRLPKCSSRSFAQKGEEAVAVEMREALLPLVRLAATLSADIKEYDKKIEELGREKYGHTALLRQVKGVGPITALAYALTLENPQRFAKSRDVGPYLGLVPKQEDSGESQPQLGISKAGDTMVRKLLVGSAQYILGPFGPDTDLRRYGLKPIGRFGREPAAIRNQQSRRYDGAQAAGGERAVHLGAVRAGHGPTTIWVEALRAWWEECEEESGGSGGPEAGGVAPPTVGEWRGVRAAAQRDVGTDRGGSLAGQGEGKRGRKREDNRHAICFGGQDRSR